MTEKMARIGIVGLGYVGSYVRDQIESRPELGLQVAFVTDTDEKKLIGSRWHRLRQDSFRSDCRPQSERFHHRGRGKWPGSSHEDISLQPPLPAGIRFRSGDDSESVFCEIRSQVLRTVRSLVQECKIIN